MVVKWLEMMMIMVVVAVAAAGAAGGAGNTQLTMPDRGHPPNKQTNPVLNIILKNNTQTQT